MLVLRASAACAATSSYHSGSSNQWTSKGSAWAQKRRQVGRSHLPLPSIASVGSGPIARRTASSRCEVDAGPIVPDLDLDPAEAVDFGRAPAAVDQRLVRQRQPADVGVVRLQPVAHGTAKQMPERNPGGLGAEVPQRDVDGGKRQLRDAGASHPLQRRRAGELLPQAHGPRTRPRPAAAVHSSCRCRRRSGDRTRRRRGCR